MNIWHLCAFPRRTQSHLGVLLIGISWNCNTKITLLRHNPTERKRHLQSQSFWYKYSLELFLKSAIRKACFLSYFGFFCGLPFPQLSTYWQPWKIWEKVKQAAILPISDRLGKQMNLLQTHEIQCPLSMSSLLHFLVKKPTKKWLLWIFCIINLVLHMLVVSTRMGFFFRTKGAFLWSVRKWAMKICVSLSRCWKQ